MADTQPNVLLICTDHWAGRYTRPAGHPVCMTPTVAQLARTGVYYPQAYSACPTCIPARRSLMTSLTARSHGDRIFKEREPMPAAPTMAQCFRDAGYQAYAVGKLHVYPQRSRIGFDEVISNEEGRHHLGAGADDWELYLQEQGYGGLEYAAGHGNNEFVARAWHLPEHCHPTNWATYQMCKTIRRRDPERPAFWYLSYVGPHQPMWPLQAYMDLYRDVPMDDPVIGDWASDPGQLPYMVRARCSRFALQPGTPEHEIQAGRRAFYACITHIDHQIRTVVGQLREAGILENTIIAFTADHGEMLGDHHMWTKAFMYEASNNVPLVLSLPEGDERLPRDVKDDRLVELVDVMPTLLDLCGIDIPETCEGRSLLKDEKRDLLYGEHSIDEHATRMIRDPRYKLIYYAAGNQTQLFDIQTDPRETRDLADDPAHRETRERLTAALIEHLYGSDLEWLKDGELVGLPMPQGPIKPGRGLSGQRGIRFL